MCGIVGVFGRIGGVEEKVFADLLQVDVIRGNDSTGIAAVRLDGSAKVVKDTALPTELLMHQSVDNLFKRVNQGWIGHNRAATKGKVTVKNAHPFICGHIVGVHNGTLNSENGLVNANTFGTDSEAIFDHLRRHGIEDTWSKVNGAAALVWWDAKQKTYNFIRNIRRPLHFAYTTDKQTLFVASEAWMIEGCISRRLGIKIDEIKYPKADDHFVFSYDNKDGVVQSGGSLTPYKSPFTTKATHTPASGSKKKFLWQDGEFIAEGEDRDDEDPLLPVTGKTGHKECTDGTSMKTNRGSSNEAEELDELFNKPMTAKRFHKLYKSCTFCRSALDYDTSIILDSFNAVCADCVAVAEADNIQLVGGM